MRATTARLKVAALMAAAALALAGCTGQTPPESRPPGGSASSDGTSDGASTDGTGPDAAGDTTSPSGEDGSTASGSGDEPGEAAGPVPAGLEQYYNQQLDWSECNSAECATLTVPIDYAEPDGDTIELALLRVPAKGERRGSLVVNPGGPGGSGVDYARQAGFVVSDQVTEVYDIVGFDPRGVGQSAPIDCLDDAELDDFLGGDPSPDDEAEKAEMETAVQEFAASCGERGGVLLGHVSTVEAARDMDVLRAALGEEQLTYLGASYGTYLGATYAELFPGNVGRLVLDGALDPNLSGLEIGLGQAEGFEVATRKYVESCVAEGDCPLGDDVESGLERIQTFLDEVDQEPLPLSKDKAGELTEGWAVLGIIVAMYDQSAWPLLTGALSEAFDGNGEGLMMLANIYASRSSDGTYDGNGMEVIYAVNCLDHPAQESDETEEEILQRFEEVSPTFGKYLAGEGACAHWPVQAAETLDSYDAAGAAPIVVIGTTRDPATPYKWAEALAETLDSGVLISYDGDGHTAYGRSNDCVDDAVDAYLLDGTVPEDGLSC